MVRTPSCDKSGLRKGTWTPEEDRKLIAYVTRYGSWNWRQLPRFAGLARCGKSCRLRWMNYLRPNLKRGNFTLEDEEIIIRLHNKLGNRWSAIAAQLPGRTDNEIKNHWHTSLKKRFQQSAAATSDAETPKSNDKETATQEATIPAAAATNDYSQMIWDMTTNSAPLSPISSSTSELSSSITCGSNENVNLNLTIEDFDDLSFLDGSFWSTELNDLADILQNTPTPSPSDEGVVPSNDCKDGSLLISDAAAAAHEDYNKSSSSSSNKQILFYGDDASFLDLDNQFGSLLDAEEEAPMIETTFLNTHPHHVPDDVSLVPSELLMMTSPPDYLSFSPLCGGADLWSTTQSHFLYHDQQHLSSF